MPKLSRRERERRRHRREVLEAAEALFAEQGFHNTTVQEVADQAQFGVGTLYNMFEDKRDIYLQLIDMRGEEYLQEVYARLEKAEGPVEKIRTALRSKMAFFTEHRQFFRIFAPGTGRERLDSRLGLPHECRQKYAEYTRKLEDVFRDGIEKGEFRDVDPGAMVLCVEGMTNAMIGRWLRSDSSDPGMPEPEVLETILFDGVLTDEVK